MVAKEMKGDIRSLKRTAKDELKSLKSGYKSIAKDLKKEAQDAKKEHKRVGIEITSTKPNL